MKWRYFIKKLFFTIHFSTPLVVFDPLQSRQLFSAQRQRSRRRPSLLYPSPSIPDSEHDCVKFTPALLRSALRRGLPAGARFCGLSTAAVFSRPDTVNRLKFAYMDTIAPSLIEEFSYKNIYQVPKIEKIVVYCAIEDARVEAARNDLALVTGQKPIKPKTQLKAAFANFRSKEAKPLGIAHTLRGNVMHSFLDRLINIGHQRIKDFQGERPSSFDGKGNYRICFREATVFPEIGQDILSRPVGLDICIKTTANTDTEAYKLLGHMGMPFGEGVSLTTILRKKKKSKSKSKARTKPKSKKR